MPADVHNLGLTKGYRRRSAAPSALPADSTQSALTVGDRHVGAMYSSLPGRADACPGTDWTMGKQ
jgi:hypothetical protein